MGFLGDVTRDMKKKAESLAAEHEDKIDDVIDKAADFAAKRTGGKHGDKIDKAAGKAHDVVDKLAAKGGGDPPSSPEP